MAYILQTWVDGIAGNTPINAARLSHLEAGVKEASDRLDAATPTTGADTIVKRDSGGGFSAGYVGITGGHVGATPTNANHIVRKDYADALGTADVVASSIARRDGTGNLNASRFYVSTTAPASAGELTRKDYVDGVRRLPRGYNTTNRTFSLGDEGMHHDFDCAGTTALTATIPAEATATFPIGSWISVGVMNPTSSLYLTIAPATGVALRSAFGTGAVTVRTNYDVVRLRKLAADIWQVDGAVTASAGVANSVVRRDGSGNVELNSVALVAAPTQTFHATRKDYVDGVGSVGATGNTIVRRNSSGVSDFTSIGLTQAPGYAAAAVRKDYVDPITSITAAPTRVGQLAVVSGIAYIAVGTSATTDWKQIS